MSTEELIAESQRIREECDNLVRLYDTEVRVQRSPRRTRHSSPAGRKKALLLLLIEELL